MRSIKNSVFYEILILGILALGIFIVTEYNFSSKIAKSSTSATVRDNGQNVDANGWVNYTDKQLGIEFSKPTSSTVTIYRELKGFDRGKKYEIVVSGVGTITALSADYGVGVGEGTRAYYSSKPLDTSRSMESIDTELKSLFYASTKPALASINGSTGVSFFILIQYGESWYAKNVIFPFNRAGYANLIIADSPPNLATMHPNQGVKEWFYGLEATHGLYTSPAFERFFQTINFTRI